MTTRADVLARLEDARGHVVVRLRDGTTREGWLELVDADAIRFEDAPSPFHAQATGTDAMAPLPEVIRIDDIEAYLDDDGVWRPMPRSDVSSS